MKTLKINGIEDVFVIEFGNIYEIVIENVKFLYDLLIRMRDCDNENILFYDNKLLDLTKESIFIGDLLNLDVNSKKIIISTYKDIEDNYIEDEQRQLLSEINKNIIEMLDSIEYKYDIPLTYNESIEFRDIFLLAGLKHKIYNNDSFLNILVNYIKVIKSISNFHILFVVNLMDYLSEEDIKLLKIELSLLNICLFSISGHKSNKKSDKLVIIDKELCQIC